MKFIEFPKMARFSREIIITEKIDGTNASITFIDELLDDNFENVLASPNGYNMRVGSRTRWISPKDDNFGFAKWCVENALDLVNLGVGTHFGEWWGSGIQCGYGLTKGDKRFSLFNTYRWLDKDLRPKCCSVVPVLYTGVFDTDNINNTLKMLKTEGSAAAPGFMKPEGIVIFHTAANFGFKKTIEKDETPKSLQ